MRNNVMLFAVHCRTFQSVPASLKNLFHLWFLRNIPYHVPYMYLKQSQCPYPYIHKNISEHLLQSSHQKEQQVNQLTVHLRFYRDCRDFIFSCCIFCKCNINIINADIFFIRNDFMVICSVKTDVLSPGIMIYISLAPYA